MSKVISKTRRKELADMCNDVIFALEGNLKSICENKKGKLHKAKLLATISSLDFICCLRAYFQGTQYWEGKVTCKQLNKILFESFNILAGEVAFDKVENSDNSIEWIYNPAKTNSIQDNSIWFGTIQNNTSDNNIISFQEITKDIIAFKNSVDWLEVRTIRNLDSHYSKINNYLESALKLDVEKHIIVFNEWFEILKKIQNFIFQIETSK